MEIGKEKAVIIPVRTLGELMAMAGSANWKTEDTKKLAADVVLLIDNVDDVEAKSELKAYMIAFGALETQARGGDAKELIDGAREVFGNEMLERVLKKIEEIETIRKRRNKK